MSALANSIKLLQPRAVRLHFMKYCGTLFRIPASRGRMGRCQLWFSDGDAAHRWWHVLWLAFQLSCGDRATI